MANSPANTGINRLLTAVNNPFGLLGGGRARVEEDTSSDDDSAAAMLWMNMTMLTLKMESLAQATKSIV